MNPSYHRSSSRSRRHSSSNPPIVVSGAYPSNPIPIPGTSYGSYNGYGASSYGQQPQPIAWPAPNSYGAPSAVPTTIIVPSSRKHRHSVSSSSHHRSRPSSSNGYYRY
jgi:hypothetical protein